MSPCTQLVNPSRDDLLPQPAHLPSRSSTSHSRREMKSRAAGVSAASACGHTGEGQRQGWFANVVSNWAHTKRTNSTAALPILSQLRRPSHTPAPAPYLGREAQVRAPVDNLAARGHGVVCGGKWETREAHTYWWGPWWDPFAWIANDDCRGSVVSVRCPQHSRRTARPLHCSAVPTLPLCRAAPE